MDDEDEEPSNEPGTPSTAGASQSDTPVETDTSTNASTPEIIS